MDDIFKPVPWPVEQLVGAVTSGTLGLPDLQRPFVWPATKVRDLMDSMYRGYPVGELMFWKWPAPTMSVQSAWPRRSNRPAIRSSTVSSA